MHPPFCMPVDWKEGDNAFVYVCVCGIFCSCVGPQGTVVKRLQEWNPSLFGFSVSHTTRPPRAGEEDGVAYHFVDAEKMQQEIEVVMSTVIFTQLMASSHSHVK